MRIFPFISILFLITFSFSYTSAQNSGIFKDCTDVGNPKLKGTTRYDESRQVYTINGSGLNMWANADQFHFASVKLTGDFILTTFCRLEGKGVNLHRKMGLIIRTDLTAGSTYADAASHGDGLTSLQYRASENAVTNEVKAAIKNNDKKNLKEELGDVLMDCLFLLVIAEEEGLDKKEIIKKNNPRYKRHISWKYKTKGKRIIKQYLLEK